jgi:mycoredoxin
MSEDPNVYFYWRPGCGFCARLERDLRRHGVVFHKLNIWEDPEAAAVVRAAARGNETVPTVVIGSTAMVNPRVEAVLAALSPTHPS